MLHKYKLNGYNIALDVNSGCVHIVDELTYDMLDNIFPPFDEKCPGWVVEKLSNFYRRDDIESCYDEIAALYREEMLFTEDEYDRLAEYMTTSPIKAMCLIAANDCNLACKYCFANGGDYGAANKSKLDYETGVKAIDFLVANSGDRENLEIDFFGGEPLLNFEIIKRLVEYGRSLEDIHGKKFRFTITTNGVLLDDEKIDYINREISNVVLSIDGRPETNDNMRVKRDGKSGCYYDIIDNYKELVKRRGDKDYYVRGTYTKHNLNFPADVIHLYEQGFDQISVEPAVGGADDDFAITKLDLPKIFMEYERLAAIMLEYGKRGKGFNFFHFMLDLNDGPCAIKRLRGCGSGNEYIAVTPEGDIYPCHQFIGIEKFLMGNVVSGEFNAEIKDVFSKAHIYNKEECKKCWAKFYCSGGCNANNYVYAGSISSPHKLSCEIQKKRIECAIMLKAAKELKKEAALV